MREHPLFLVGFRPFFVLTILSGAALPLLWALAFAGKLNLHLTGISVVQWHVHEMFFGFGWAILGGFLLTASKNWVKIRGLHGGWLVVAVLMWLVERLGIWFYGSLPGGLRLLAVNAFIFYVAAYILWSLLYYRKQDSFRDNYFFVIALPLFIVAKNLVLSPEYYIQGWMMTLGLFRLAFVVMFERTITQFMKNSMEVTLIRNPYLDYGIKFFALISVFAGFMPEGVGAAVLLIAGLLLGIRFVLWNPHKGLSTFAIGLSYFGYLALTVHFFLEFLRVQNQLPSIGALSVHVFTFLCMGVVIPAMMIRIAQGHTGRKLLFTGMDRVAIACMGAGAFFRLVMTQIQPQGYFMWIALAGIGWALCFILLGIRLIPFLWQPRIDGKVH
ncbi:NnrS family protein [Bdellovibrio bacteriovorus]|uniref:NnrS family protein n=1 Tax=Bdellovibrio bacteriovorus TaxID=959 RepID=UPI0035A6D3E8